MYRSGMLRSYNFRLMNGYIEVSVVLTRHGRVCEYLFFREDSSSFVRWWWSRVMLSILRFARRCICCSRDLHIACSTLYFPPSLPSFLPSFLAHPIPYIPAHDNLNQQRPTMRKLTRHGYHGTSTQHTGRGPIRETPPFPVRQYLINPCIFISSIPDPVSTRADAQTKSPTRNHNPRRIRRHLPAPDDQDKLGPRCNTSNHPATNIISN